MTKTIKPPLTLEEQVELLISRGLIINDTNFAIKILSRINYYRLSAYSLSLRDNDVFNKGTTFEQIYQLYEFDAKLRHLMLDIIESLEIKFRTEIAYYLAMEHGAMSYLDKNIFHNPQYHHRFSEDFNREKELQANSAFVAHHNRAYDGKMPIWVAIELFSFGMLSKFYNNFKQTDKNKFVCSYLNKPRYFQNYLSSWLKSLVEIRNICAHYGRIYNRALNSSPKVPREFTMPKQSYKKLFPVILITVLSIDNYKMSTSFIINIKTLIEQYDVVDINLLGFPANWENILMEARK